MTNEKNLISLKNRSKEERSKIAQKGGINSGKTRRKNIELKKRLEIMLSCQDVNGEFEEDNICRALIEKAKAGNIRAFEVIRDTVIPKNQQIGNIKLSQLTEEQIRELGDIALKRKKEAMDEIKEYLIDIDNILQLVKERHPEQKEGLEFAENLDKL